MPIKKHRDGGREGGGFKTKTEIFFFRDCEKLITGKRQLTVWNPPTIWSETWNDKLYNVQNPTASI